MESDGGATNKLVEQVNESVALKLLDSTSQSTFEQSAVHNFDLSRLSPIPEDLRLEFNQSTINDTDYDSDPLDDDILSRSYDNLFDILLDECKTLDNLIDGRTILTPEVGDPDAFNELLIKRRQWVIDNQAYRKILNQWRTVNTIPELVTLINFHTHRKPMVNRAWFVFYWIATNITYDFVSSIPGKCANQSPNAVFQARKAVCTGYTSLFKRLCAQVGIQCECISGFTKAQAVKHKKGIIIHPDHTWNAIRIEQHWYLVDMMWAAGNLTDNKTKFECNLNVHNFLARPDEFIYSHLPKNHKWQQLKTPINIVQYAQMLNIYPTYFRLGLELVLPWAQEKITLLPGKPFAMLSMRAPFDVQLSGCLILEGRKIAGGHYIAFSIEMNLWKCYFAPKSIGKHTIAIYGCKKNEHEGTCAIELNFDVTDVPEHLISFPKLWHAFFTHSIQVVYPRNTHAIHLHSLNKNHSQVLIRTSINVELMGKLMNSNGITVKGGERVYFDRHAAVWRCKFAPDHTGLYEACIYARKRSESNEINVFTPVIAFELEVNHLDSSISYPELFQRFFDLDLRLISPTSQSQLTYRKNSHFVQICIRSPINVHFVCHMKYSVHTLMDASFSQFNADAQYWEFDFAPQCVALHHCIISARSDEEPFQLVAQFDLNITRFIRPMIFPSVYPRFYVARCYIYEPLEGILTSGTTVYFRYYLPGAKRAFVEVDSDRGNSQTLVESVFEQSVIVGRDKVTVFVQFDRYYELLVKYRVYNKKEKEK